MACHYSYSQSVLMSPRLSGSPPPPPFLFFSIFCASLYRIVFVKSLFLFHSLSLSLSAVFYWQSSSEGTAARTSSAQMIILLHNLDESFYWRGRWRIIPTVQVRSKPYQGVSRFV